MRHMVRRAARSHISPLNRGKLSELQSPDRLSLRYRWVCGLFQNPDDVWIKCLPRERHKFTG